MRKSCAEASSPTTPSSVTRAPIAAMLRATFAAPPGISENRSTLTTGIGASGEIRSTDP